MRPGYDFSSGVRGKYAERYARGSNVVVLAPDVAEVFRTATAVNAALRSQMSRRASLRPRRKKRTGTRR
jgi:hypothetical protein